MVNGLAYAVSAVPAIQKLIQGLHQGSQADNLKKRDTTPPAFTEALQLGRQAAASSLPGAGAELSQVNASTDAALAAGAKAGTSSQSIMSLLGAIDASKSRYLTDLARRTDDYHQQKQRELGGLLTKRLSE